MVTLFTRLSRVSHVPTHSPFFRDSRDSVGSPLSNEAATSPEIMGLPQSSTTRTVTDLGRPAGTENSGGKDRIAGISLAGAQWSCASRSAFGPPGGAAITTVVTLTLVVAPSSKRNVRTPLWMPGLKPNGSGCTTTRVGASGRTVCDGRQVHETITAVRSRRT